MTYKQLLAMVLLSKVDIALGDITLTIHRVPGGWNLVYQKGVGATLRMACQFVKEKDSAVERARDVHNGTERR